MASQEVKRRRRVDSRNELALATTAGGALLGDVEAAGEAPVEPGATRTQKTRRRSRRQGFGVMRRPLIMLVELIVVIGAWQIVSSAHVMPANAVSSPYSVAREFAQGFVTQRFIWTDLATSGEEVGIGYSLGLAVGVLIGFLMGSFRTAREAFDPIVMFLYAIPMVAVAPLLIVWFGIGLLPKVLLVFVAVTLVITVNTEVGVHGVDRALLDMARTFRVSRLAVIRKVVLPSSLPSIIAGMRLAVGLSLIMVVVAELFGATKGIGYYIINAGTSYNTAGVLMGIFILAIVSIAFSSALRSIERRVAPWKE